MTPGAWIVPWSRDAGDDPRPALICLPQAGAGCGQYRAWQERLAGTFAVSGIALPGREARWGEPPATSIEDLIGAVADELTGRIPDTTPLVVFGRSFGGLLGFELVRRLEGHHGRRVDALVVAACRPPHHWVGAGGGVTEDELHELVSLAGLDDADEDTRELALDVLRQDVELSRSYTRASAAVAAPLHAWGGKRDPIVTADQLAGWSDYTTGGFRIRLFPGHHDFCGRDPSVVSAFDDVRTATPAGRGGSGGRSA